MKTLLAMLAISVLIAGSATLQAQQQDQERQQSRERQTQQAQPAAAGQEKQQSVTGCLQKAGAQGAFVLQTDGGDQLMVQGSSDLAQHVNHKVTITGSIDSASRTLRPTNVEMVSASCK
jgi:hypothetical protein